MRARRTISPGPEPRERGDDRPNRGALLGAHHHRRSDRRRIALSEKEGERASGGGEPDRHVRARDGSLHDAPCIGRRRRSELQDEPVSHDLRAGVPVEGSERAVDGRERADEAGAVERRQEPLQDRLEIGVGQCARVRAG